MTSLYNDAPTVSFSLEQFTAAASEMYQSGNYDDSIRFVLSGEFLDDDGNRRQAFVDPIRGAVDDDHPLTISRDYDSAIGISPDILVDGLIAVFAVPHPTFALKTSIHMSYAIEYEGAIREVEFHRIPNFEFGTFGARHSLHIFFPKLWCPERHHDSSPHQLTRDQRAAWYDKALRPAIYNLLGAEVAAEWPATYQTEEIRASKHRGGYSWGTKIIQRDVTNDLMQRIRLELLMSEDDDLEWALDAFVMHTIRGVKDGTKHHVDPNSASYYLEELFSDAQLVEDAPTLGEWFIDVGIQISSEEEDCVQWRTATHHLVAQQALRISDRNAERITQINSSKYNRDLASHLTAVSGFRVEPGDRAAGEFEAAYVQAYTTDKSVVYNIDGSHHAKYLTTREALDSTQPTKTIEGIHDIYKAARKVNASSARLEVRVPYYFATRALLEFDADVLRSCVCLFKREEWWSFRIIRLMGFSQTLSLQQSGPTPNRFMPESLTLTAACVWLVNGLHARPDDGSAARNLMDSVLPITEAEDANLDVLAYNTSIRPRGSPEPDYNDFLHGRVPYNPHGCIFLRRIMLPEVPRMRNGGPNLSPPAFKFWFHGKSVLELQSKYRTTGVIDRRVVAATRSTTSKVKMPVYVNLNKDPEPNLFNFTAQGHSLPPLIDDNLSDFEDRESPPPQAGPADIDDHLSAIWRQFVCDLTSKSPNQSGSTSPSYLKLNDIQRRSGSETPYKNLHLSELFVAVYYKQASRDMWETSFNWLFPPLGRTIASNVQNYPQSPYYGQWANFLERNQGDLRLITDVRKEFLRRVLQWGWMPHAQGDRMWPTAAHRKSSRKFTRWPPAPGHPAAPHILLHRNGVPDLSPPAANAFDGEVIEIDSD